MLLLLRRLIALAGVCAAGACSSPTTSAPAPDGSAILFEGARLIVGDGSQPIERSAFVVRGDSIVDAGRAGEIEVPQGVTRVDLSGKTVIPALIDAHSHLGYTDVRSMTTAAAHFTRENLIDHLRRYAHYGIAATLSMGVDRGEVAYELRAQPAPGAALLRTAGRGIALPNAGPGAEYRRDAAYGVSNESEARAAVRELADRQADVVKIWVDDRNGTVPKLPPALYRAIIDEAHARGLRVVAHIFDLADAKDLLRAGIDGFAHGVRDVDVDEEFVRLIAERPNVFVIPNLPDRDTSDDYAWLSDTVPAGEISVDLELGMAYLPVELPTHDYYGGARPGDNLFGESLVAVDLKTGERKWHFQLVHHGIWDMDIPCAPILADITVNGRTIKAVAQPTKQAFLYVFDRVTGQPIWPIEERPVPQGDTPGEKYSKTQPFPSRPAAYDRQGLAVDDLIDFTPELRAEAVKAIAQYRIGPIFTPPVVSRAEGPIATLQMASQGAATNWPGGSYDPETHILYVQSQSQVATLGLVPPPPGAAPEVRYHQGTVLTGARRTGGSGSAGAAAGGNATAPSVQGLPLIKPPYGQISAISLDTGDILWQIPHGETPDAIRNHPALKGLTIPRTGRPGSVGTLVTKTLVIAGEPGFGVTPSGQRGSMLRAYDKRTGAEVGAVYMPAPQTGSPMTYLLNGRQYLVVAISGGAYSGELLAFRLPG